MSGGSLLEPGAMKAIFISFSLLINSNYVFISFWLCWVSVAAWALPRVASSRGRSLVGEHRLLTVVASLVSDDGLQSVGSVFVAQGLSYPAASGIFPDQGSSL